MTALANNTRLRQLNVAENGVSHGFASSFLRGVRSNASLRWLAANNASDAPSANVNDNDDDDEEEEEKEQEPPFVELAGAEALMAARAAADAPAT